MAASKPVKGLRIKDYTLDKEIGRGAFGIVYSAVSRSNGKRYAIKRIITDVDKTQVNDEMKIFEKLSKHENVVNVIEYFFHPTKQKVFFAMEYCDGGDLESYIVNKEPAILEAFDYMADITNGLSHLHLKHIIHRDLKPQNILISKGERRNVCKISDFGISKVGFSTVNYFKTKCGTMVFAAPEVFDMFEYTYSADIFSLGLLFYVMKIQMVFEEKGKKYLLPLMKLQGKPVPVSTVARRKELRRDKFLEEFFSDCEILGNLVFEMLSYDHHDRPAIDDVMVRLAEAKGSYGRGAQKDTFSAINELLEQLMMVKALSELGILKESGGKVDDTFEDDAVDGVIQVIPGK